MPELPEVETIRKGLEKYLVGHRVERILVTLPKQFTGSPDDIIGAVIVGVTRFGKGLVITFDNQFSLIIHVKMTGQLVYRGLDIPTYLFTEDATVGKLPNKYTHVIFYLDHEGMLFYNDMRQFGWIKVVKTNTIKEVAFFKELGPEFLPAGKQTGLEKAQFIQIVQNAQSPIKQVIMDQKKMAGVGNIYANDALFLAKINPQRSANKLSVDETEQLFDAIITVLQKGIQEGGASSKNYVNALGEVGNYQNYMLVYGKEGQQCICGEIIKKIIVGGRGTFFCEQCQI